jgi:hypothetical protein
MSRLRIDALRAHLAEPIANPCAIGSTQPFFQTIGVSRMIHDIRQYDRTKKHVPLDTSKDPFDVRNTQDRRHEQWLDFLRQITSEMPSNRSSCFGIDTIDT